MDGAYGTHILMRNAYKSYSKNLKKGNHFEDLDLDGTLIVKLEVLGRTTHLFFFDKTRTT
jgi:hypothetical protein